MPLQRRQVGNRRPLITRHLMRHVRMLRVVCNAVNPALRDDLAGLELLGHRAFLRTRNRCPDNKLNSPAVPGPAVRDRGHRRFEESPPRGAPGKLGEPTQRSLSGIALGAVTPPSARY